MKVSIIVPVFNSQDYLYDCIASILCQTYRNIEVLVINDGSTDDSMKIIESFFDNRIVAIDQPNSGVSSARNNGIRHSTGDFICFVDSDDVLNETFVENMVESACVSGADAVFGNCYYLYNDGSTVAKLPRVPEGRYLSKDFYGKCVDDGTLSGILFGNVWGALYKTATIQDNRLFFDEALKVNEDGVFNIEFLLVSSCISVISGAGYGYRQTRSEKRNDELSFASPDLDKATEALAILSKSVDNGNLQMKRRRMSVFFWQACRVGNTKGSVIGLSRKLKYFCKGVSNLKDDYKALDYSRINKYKKILISLLRYRFYFVFTLLMKFVAPKMVGKVRH